MAVTIVRTNWIDDDGTGTTGTVINNAVKTSIYNEIDGALAKVAQLAGGNSFTGNQVIAGLLSVSGLGTHAFVASGAGTNTIQIMNTVAGTGNAAQLLLGTDTSPFLTVLSAFSSTYTPSGYNMPNGSALLGVGANGLSLATSAAAPLRFYTNNAERARILGTGEVVINTPTNGGNAQVFMVWDASVRNGFVIQNLYTANAGYFVMFVNSALGTAGTIQQMSATTVAYNTASDARLKDDGGRAVDLTALRALVVHDFTWKADGIRDRGIFAQEAHALYPRAVSKGTDDRTDSGTLALPWMTDYSKFVPDLIAGWQHHDAELAALRAELATLKG
jgi:hypothetical protein